MPKLPLLQPVCRRVLAVDAGSRQVKLLLAERAQGRLRVVEQTSIDLQENGLITPQEIKSHLKDFIEQWDRPPLAIVLPQHLSISQVIDLPAAPEEEVEKLIHDETVKLSGVSESRIVYDFVRTETLSKNRQQFWVTLCQEGDIRDRILQLGVENEDICEITTTANALMEAYRSVAPNTSRAVLLHMGAQTTVAVIVMAGKGVFAASFQMGGDFFTRTLARLRSQSESAAEFSKRERDWLTDPSAPAEFKAAVDGWIAELKGQINEWFSKNLPSPSDAASFEMVASGSAFDQPGLVPYINTKANLRLKSWPAAQSNSPAAGFEIAYGAALQAVGLAQQPVSLLPEEYRAATRRRIQVQRIEFASLALLIIGIFILSLAIWTKVNLISTKQSLLAKIQAGQEAVDANTALNSDLLSQYETFRPLFAKQQTTLNALKTLAVLGQTHSNRTFWYVLMADQHSYFKPPASFINTNKPTRTNLSGTALIGPLNNEPFALASTNNLFSANFGFIAELSIPENPESARRILAQLVQDLRQLHLFSKADLLSDDLRQNLADPKVTIPDRDFVLALNFAETDFQQPLRAKRSQPQSRPARRPERSVLPDDQPSPIP
jgi:Tfp pilus assembly PilM family ATPase